MPTEMKDGLGNEFTLRTKDISPSQNNSIRQNWHLATRYPIEHASGGAFECTLKSGLMAANVLTDAPIFNFRFVSPSLICLLRRLEFSFWNVTTNFGAVGIASFDALVARAFSSEDTGGALAALAGNTGKLRTSHQSPLAHMRASTTAPLTPGTRTPDGQPFENIITNVTATANAVFLNNAKLFEEDDHPIVLATNEGVIIQATVPGTGTWSFNVTAAWDEIEANNY